MMPVPLPRVSPFRLLMAATILGPGCTAPPPSEPPPLTFTEVTAEAGLNDFRHETGARGDLWFPETMGAGVAFTDVDGDDRPDVLLVGGGTWAPPDAPPALRLYHNEGDGTFSDRTAAYGLAGVRAYGFGLAAADYDNDGDTDVFLSTLYENLLFRNDGGTFSEVGRDAGLAGTAEWSTSALFFDADRDGHLDLYVGNYVDWSPEKDVYCAFEGQKVYCTPVNYTGIRGRYYHNEGDGTFTDRTREAGFADGIDAARDKTLGVAELDYNRDGWPDLFLGNDTERDLLYENDGDGTFTERGIMSGVAYNEHGRARAGMGVDAGVVDSTGAVSLFVGNFSDEMAGVYRHTGDGLFVDRAAASRVGRASLRTLTFGLLLFDVDRDTDLDLLLANGHVQTHIEKMLDGITFRQPAQLYRNHGDGTFDEVAFTDGPFSQPLVARGAAWADYDRDGDLDLLLTENDGPAHLWRNDTPGGAFLHLRLEGRRSNRDGLGARVVAQVGRLRMERRVHTGSSYLSQSETAAVFGLGAAPAVDSLWVYWPGGQVDRFGPVPGNRFFHLVEGDTTLYPADRPAP